MITAVLFDLDGTLVDNMPFHFRAWRTIADGLGIKLDDARIQREFAGKKNAEIIPALLERAVTAQEIAEIGERKEALYRELYRPAVKLVAGAETFLDALQERGLRLAIASAAPPENRKMVLDALGIASRFVTVVGGEEVAHGKPAPDIFLLAAERVGAAGAECLVFEDAVLGVRAAKAAGAHVIGVTTVEEDLHLRAAGASETIVDYEDAPARLPDWLSL